MLYSAMQEPRLFVPSEQWDADLLTGAAGVPWNRYEGIGEKSSSVVNKPKAEALTLPDGADPGGPLPRPPAQLMLDKAPSADAPEVRLKAPTVRAENGSKAQGDLLPEVVLVVLVFFGIGNK